MSHRPNNAQHRLEAGGLRARRGLRALPTLATAIAAALLLAACGGGSQTAAERERASEAKAEAKLANFAKCMREHGIDVETAKGANGQGVRLKATGGGAGRQGSLEAAQSACKRYQPEPRKVNLSPQEKVEREEAVLKFARCMREHGINVHASANGGGIQIAIQHHLGEGGPNPESPAFQKAQTTCQKLLPGAQGGKSTPSHSSAGNSEGSQSSGLSLSAGG